MGSRNPGIQRLMALIFVLPTCLGFIYLLDAQKPAGQRFIGAIITLVGLWASIWWITYESPSTRAGARNRNRRPR